MPSCRWRAWRKLLSVFECPICNLAALLLLSQRPPLTVKCGPGYGWAFIPSTRLSKTELHHALASQSEPHTGLEND